MPYENLLMSREEGIVTLTVNRPRALNALNTQTLRELFDAASQCAADSTVQAVILTGAGEKAFVAGADISELSALTPEKALVIGDLGHGVFGLLESIGQPVLAAVNGYALGGGLELALACDFIYASDNAVFGQPEVSLGLIPGWGGTQRLARRVGPGLAREIIYTGRRVDARRAQEIGLVNGVVAQAELLSHVRGVAADIARQAPLAVRASKRAIRLGLDVALERGNEIEKQTFAALFGTEDAREGTRAFLEKRPPRWQGR